MAEEWMVDEQAAVNRGEHRDPRAGRVLVEVWYQRWIASRVVVPATKARLESAWRTHCGPRWGGWPLDAITRMEAQAWVTKLTQTPRSRHQGRTVQPGEHAPMIGPRTVENAVALMTGLYRAAVRESLVARNPFEQLDLPRKKARVLRFFERDEAARLLAALRDMFPPQYAILVELGFATGMREGELFGLTGDRVDWIRRLITVVNVSTRHGLRDFPKTEGSERTVPAPPHLVTAMSGLMVGRPRDALVFTSHRGYRIGDSTFRQKTWNPAVEVAGVPHYPPSSMRHTCASWLAIDGVPLYDIQVLLGHTDPDTTQIYAQLGPHAHTNVVASWTQRKERSG